MKLYGIIECYTYFSTTDATNWGVRRTLEEAKSALFEIIEQQFHHIRENIIYKIEEEKDGVATMEEIESRWQEWIEEHLEEGGYGSGFTYKWEMFDDDCEYKFYIDELELSEK